MEWARTQNNLGNVLQILGKQTSDAAVLRRAEAAYRARWRNGPASARRWNGPGPKTSSATCGHVSAN